MSHRLSLSPARLALLLALLAPVACGGNDDEAGDTAAVEDSSVAMEEQAPEPTAADTAATEPAAPSGDSIARRPAEIVATVTGDESWAGNYQASGITRICGADTPIIPGQPPAFQVQFPYEGDFEIVDVNFSAKDLTPGGSTSRYHLDLALRTKKGGRPPGLVIRAGDPAHGETGTAKLTVNGSDATIEIEGRNSRSQVKMTVKCGKRAG